VPSIPLIVGSFSSEGRSGLTKRRKILSPESFFQIRASCALKNKNLRRFGSLLEGTKEAREDYEVALKLVILINLHHRKVDFLAPYRVPVEARAIFRFVTAHGCGLCSKFNQIRGGSADR
jgi:hypothetical protein